MPMVWDTAADAKLMVAILKACKVKVSGAHLEAVAQYMGPECTPRAVSHRLAAIRKKAAELGGGNQDAHGTETPKSKKAKTTNTAANGDGKKRAAAKGRNATTNQLSDDEHEEYGKRSASFGKKRFVDGNIKREPTEDDDGIQVGEDVGEGWRANNDCDYLT